MQSREKQNIFTDDGILEKEKLSNNFASIINKDPIESRENYNMLNIPNYEMDNFKSATKIYKHTNPSNSATPIKLFNGVPNLISPFKEGQDIYNNSPIKMDMDFGSPFGGILSPAKKSCISEDNINNNNKEIIPGKKINFNEEVTNLNLIQNRKNSYYYKSGLKEESKSAFFLSPTKANINDNEINYQNLQVTSGQVQNKINLPPNTPISSLNANKNISNNKIINGSMQEKNIITNNKIIKNIQDNNNINYVLKNIKKVCCTCTRTQCQKKYCACFSLGKPCQGCDCKGCLNVPKENANIIPDGRDMYNNPKEENVNIQRNLCQESKAQAIVCNCTKSRCMKKYCECFKMNIPCGNLCRCIDCQNKDNQNIYSNMDINNSEKNMNMINNLDYNKNINDIQKNNIQNDYIEKLKELSRSYTINAMGIHINNRKLILQERDFDLNRSKINLNTTPKLTNKKRTRTKNENSNLKTCPTTISASRRKKRGYSQVNSNVKTKKLIMS